jgi:hypothetical protein
MEATRRCALEGIPPNPLFDLGFDLTHELRFSIEVGL